MNVDSVLLPHDLRLVDNSTTARIKDIIVTEPNIKLLLDIDIGCIWYEIFFSINS